MGHLRGYITGSGMASNPGVTGNNTSPHEKPERLTAKQEPVVKPPDRTLVFTVVSKLPSYHDRIFLVTHREEPNYPSKITEFLTSFHQQSSENPNERRETNRMEERLHHAHRRRRWLYL